MRVRKYIEGAPFVDALEAAACILAGNYTMFHGQPMHPSWTSGWSLTTLRNLSGSSRHALCRAVINPEWKPKPEKADPNE